MLLAGSLLLETCSSLSRCMGFAASVPASVLLECRDPS